MKYIELLSVGLVTKDQIDDFIDEWHSSETVQELHEYLGMTWNDFDRWLRNDDYLDNFISN